MGSKFIGAKPIQIPSGEGSAVQMIAEAKSNIESLEKSIESANKSIGKWNNEYGRDLVILLEYLEREESIYTAPTLMAVSNQAFVLDGWIPSSDKARVEKALAKVASHISIEKHVEDHHHHDDHHDDWTCKTSS